MITIGITTYNRKDILEIMAASLYNSDISVPHNIRIFDDCSKEFGMEELKRIFPTAASVSINENNMKADKNIFIMYRDFLVTGDSFLFSADADLLFSKNWLKAAIELVKKTSGILTLFNANSHVPNKILDNDLCLKKTIGNAGTLIHRNRIEEFMKHIGSIENVKAFDWQFSDYFNAMNIPIYSVNNSLVQHIGHIGQNTNFYFDYGRNFKIETLENGQVINNMFECYIDNIRRIDMERTGSIWYHARRIIIIIMKKLLPERLFNFIRKKVIKNP